MMRILGMKEERKKRLVGMGGKEKDSDIWSAK